MISIKRLFFAGTVACAAAGAFVASGCGVASASGMQRAAEVRGATALAAGSPQLIVSGPARLLHVDVRGRQALSIYSVKRDARGAVNCADKLRSKALPLRQGVSNELNLEVHHDEAICLANDGGDAAPRIADVSWHARRGADAPIEMTHASNLEERRSDQENTR
jgi:hypothetical protein